MDSPCLFLFMVRRIYRWIINGGERNSLIRRIFKITQLSSTKVSPLLNMPLITSIWGRWILSLGILYLSINLNYTIIGRMGVFIGRVSTRFVRKLYICIMFFNLSVSVFLLFGFILFPSMRPKIKCLKLDFFFPFHCGLNLLKRRKWRFRTSFRF